MGAGQNKSLPLTAFSHWMHLWIVLNRQYMRVVAISCIVDAELFRIYSIENKSIQTAFVESLRNGSVFHIGSLFSHFFFLSILRSRFRISRLKSLQCGMRFNYTQECPIRMLVKVQWQVRVYNDLTKRSLFATVASIQWHYVLYTKWQYFMMLKVSHRKEILSLTTLSAWLYFKILIYCTRTMKPLILVFVFATETEAAATEIAKMRNSLWPSLSAGCNVQVIYGRHKHSQQQIWFKSYKAT